MSDLDRDAAVDPRRTEEPGGARARSNPAARRRWIGAGAATVFVHATAFLVFAVSPVAGPTRKPPESRVSWATDLEGSGRSVIDEQLAVFGSEPLFLPTSFNYAGSATRPRPPRDPGDIFDYAAPRYLADEGMSPPALDAVPETVATPAAAALGFSTDPLAAFGTGEVIPVSLPVRVALIEIRSIGGEERVVVHEVPLAAVPAEGWSDWVPMEVFVFVDGSGAPGQPLVARTSGSDRADAFFRDYIRRVLRPNLMLSPGYYRVTIGP